MSESIEHTGANEVVVGIDGSSNATDAARWAAAEAECRGVPLRLVHALHLPNGAAIPLEPAEYAERARAEGRKLLASAQAALTDAFPGLTIVTGLSDLSAARTLSVLSTDAALLVTGTRGHGGFAGMLLGSVSRKLAAHSHSPLVVVRGEHNEQELEKVVVGIEPDEPQAAIRYAFAAAERYGAVLHAVRAWYPYSTYASPTGVYLADFDEVRNDERRDVEKLIAPFRNEFPDVKIEISATRGNPVPNLAEAARGARLLVLGAHRHRGPLSVGAGYVVGGLLAHCPTPVAIVPTH